MSDAKVVVPEQWIWDRAFWDKDQLPKAKKRHNPSCPPAPTFDENRKPEEKS